jgi:UDP-N-acetylglucosamine--dolichyl-phosphate N-acetylglucosaminephosphotransferase
MFDGIFWISAFISFIVVWILAPYAKKFLEGTGILAIDQQKKGKPRIATSGGLVVAAGIFAGGFFYIGIITFFTHAHINLLALLASYCSILIITLVGFLDDINVRAEPKNDKGLYEHRVGLKQWQKPLLTLSAAVPLMAINAGVTSMDLPFIGKLDLGILYPLILIPIGVVCASNATNMLAGMNGLEAGLGFVSHITLGAYALYFNRLESALLSFTIAFSLLAFLRWNWYPAKFLPGDSLTYLIGSTFVSAVIIGNIEKFGIIIFIPWILEAFLKLRSKFGARSLGILQKDGSLKAPYKKIYSLTHIVMKCGRFNEKQIAFIIIAFEAIICILAFWFMVFGFKIF